MITFQEIKVTRIKLGTTVRRIYSSDDKKEADNFANLFSGSVYEYLPEVWRIII